MAKNLRVFFVFFLFSIMFAVISCSKDKDIALPQDQFSISDSFGDGYIAKIPSSNSENELTIISILVEQWLEHYKTNSDNTKTRIRNFSIDSINMLEKPSESVYLGVAGVKFSIIPSVIPNDFASFPGEEINPDSEWWHLVNIFGYYQIGEFYYLRILPGWGT